MKIGKNKTAMMKNTNIERLQERIIFERKIIQKKELKEQKYDI